MQRESRRKLSCNAALAACLKLRHAQPHCSLQDVQDIWNVFILQETGFQSR